MALALCLCTSAAAQHQDLGGTRIADLMVRMTVRINGQAGGEWPILERRGILYAPQEALATWNLRRRANAETVEADGRVWFALSSIPGFGSRVDFGRRTLDLIAPQGEPAQRATPATLIPSLQLSMPPASATPGTPAATTQAAAPTPAPAPITAPRPTPAPAPMPAPAAAPPAAAQPAPASAAASSTVAAPATAAGDKAPRLVPLDVSVNGSAVGAWTLLDVGGVLHAQADALEEWRLKRGATSPVRFRGEDWYPLAGIPGFQARLNPADQSVSLVFSPTAFAATRLAGAAGERPPVTPAMNTAFLNYDVNLTHTSARSAASTRDLGMLSELGASGDWGVLVTSQVARQVSGAQSSRSLVRLETTYTLDMPERDLTLRLGDSATRTGLFGSAQYFGGVQLTRNFGLRPGYFTQPLPVIAGTASAASTVELYINDALRQTSNVPSGPFTIDNFPIVSGAGEARVVVRDILGRETVLVQPFFTHSDLLEQGLNDWSVEAGWMRRNLGSVSYDYGDLFVSGLLRRGLTKFSTVDLNAQVSGSAGRAALGLTQALPWQMLGQAAASWSRSDASGDGYKWLLGVERAGLQHGFGARVEGASLGYREIGWDATVLANRILASANYTYAITGNGSLGLGIAHAQNHGGSAVRSVSANYSLRLGRMGALSFSATQTDAAGVQSRSLGATLVLPLDGGIATSSTVTRRGDATEVFATASRPASSEIGSGWRALAGHRPSGSYAEGGVYYQGGRGMLSADVASSAGTSSLRLGAQGGLVLADGSVFASRRVNGAFALVEVPGYPDVAVGFQGSKLVRTDANGRALLPGMVPYTPNSIRIDPTELPINAELDTIELTVVPPARSGVRVAFPVRSGRAALLRILLADGDVAPPGAEIRIDGDDRDFYVARRGEAFVTGLQAKNILTLKWKGQSCRLELVLPPSSNDDILRPAPLSCTGVAR